MKLLPLAAAAAAVFCTSALAAKPPPGASLSGDQCILVRDIRNHSVVDQNTMLLDVYRKGVYRVTTANACFRSAVSTDRIAFTRGREKICRAEHLGLAARSGPCDAQSIVKLSPEEVAALPRKLKP